MSEPLLTITAYGTPVGQGAISHGRHGRGYHSNAATLLPWRAAVAAAAMRTAGTHAHQPPLGIAPRSGPCLRCGIRRAEHGLLDGPLALAVDIALPILKSDPDRAEPTTRSSHDWDHHARAVGDALGEASIWRDDSQVVDGRLRKRYVGHPDALERPGALIRIWKAS
ncbi:RusA family crossover junction endodeoxyribonuclease [Planobispora longispora]|uniref:Uncharacterized protein n=1 Tax=Planobispora longispora TaxID=28887 RepID=A0A8J3RJK4_9ACTN|nr:RusA family crossover junction endodeoxyribonuclease [Planobispora longispora]BFE85803.1 hypothetical protein GCM10020093_084040 [Planobispora longispora]GIH76163.1 hypothetical protein Plo01_25920 [Planobispora longispora]